MKKTLIMSVLVTLLSFSGCKHMKNTEDGKKDTSVTKKDLENDTAKESYAMGLDMANNLKSRNFDIDPDLFYAGFKTGLDGREPLLTDEEQKAALMAMQQRMMQQMQAKMGKKATGNKKKGKKFLEENKKKEGVIVTDSGLQYTVKKKGSGKKPSAEDMVKVHYKGTFIDGTEFDSSYKRGQPVTFPLNKVIPGWTEGLQLMSEGAKYTFYIPSNLAYGDRGNKKVEPGKTLIFDVELISVGAEK